jgi:peptidyl-tRNA hydrolase, PTH1 family
VKVIVGLGNPGKRYADTPHNVGFDVADELADRFQARFRRSLRFKARIAQGTHGRETLLLVKPQTYMNNSGEAVGAVVRYRKLEVSDTVVIVDDADLGLGRLRIRPGGGSGGHRGLQSIIRHLGSDTFARVRVGIGRRRPGEQLTAHVLSPFAKQEREQVARTVQRAADAVQLLLEEGVDAAMNDFNGPPPDIGDGDTRGENH